MHPFQPERDDTDPKPRYTFTSRLRALGRQTRDRLGIVFYLVASTFIAFSIWGVVRNIAVSGWGTDAAAWVQAAGSIAAIVGAASLAQAEVRRADGARLRQFETSVDYVRFVIVQAQVECHSIARDLLAATSPTQDQVEEWQQRIRTASIGLSALAGRSDYTHASIGHMIANAKILMDDLAASLIDLAAVVARGEIPTSALRGKIVSPHAALLQLLDQFDGRLKLIRETMAG